MLTYFHVQMVIPSSKPNGLLATSVEISLIKHQSDWQLFSHIINYHFLLWKVRRTLMTLENAAKDGLYRQRIRPKDVSIDSGFGRETVSIVRGFGRKTVSIDSGFGQSASISISLFTSFFSKLPPGQRFSQNHFRGVYICAIISGKVSTYDLELELAIF